MSVLRAGLGVGLGAVLGALVLAGCALPAAMGPATPDMPQLADPARAFAVAGGALGARSSCRPTGAGRLRRAP